MSSRISLTFIIVDDSNNSVVFDRAEICLSGRFECEKDYRSLIVKLKEEQSISNSSVSLNLAKFSDYTKLGEAICYYLSGKNAKNYFSLDKFSGVLTAKQTLDREFRERYELVVKASEHCFCDGNNLELSDEEKQICQSMRLGSEDEFYDINDISQLRVVLVIEDINDNSPKFEKNLYQAGIISDMQKAEVIFESFVSLKFTAI